ncbi:MAG: Na+/H+ antiporter NhaA [Spirochaetales bacterium]|nr:Na+/H+ antiporter NhaA [Leptospiraceae bacterium]MCP5482040.1 Na+/H+ antiporter NhaA [Spirochaetales bacterium]MCP5486521.1 Na+/H+ antiporter NhaA [Spirochaetales bacterium]
MTTALRKTVNILTEFSIPLIGGVIAALILANGNLHIYEAIVDTPLLPGVLVFGHEVNLHFLVNDIFMVLFFGIAAVEITQAVLPGGSLNPISRAANPIMGTLGGVLGPVACFFILCHLLNVEERVYRGWGIPTATDIALAWLVARIVFGNRHPAVSFLLLLAVADDAIGLGIIAVFYPDPHHPVEVYYLALTALGMLVAFLLRKGGIRNMWLYVVFGGGLAWLGLIMAHLHPALALVFIVPFMPSGHGSHEQLFADEASDHSTITNFEHTFKMFVDIGLFGFGFANAGVTFAGITEVTWIIFTSLLVGKTVGITLFSLGAQAIGFRLPNGMNLKTLVLSGVVAGLGLTVALFVAGQAFTEPAIQGAAKMGAVLSGAIGVIAILLGRVLRVKRVNE